MSPSQVEVYFWLWALVIGLLACASDVRSNKIPNRLTLVAPLVSVCAHAFFGGFAGLLHSLAGWVVGFVLFFPFFLLRGMGAGDVKLLAALGSTVGPTLGLWVALYAALSGGLMALIVALARGYLRTALINIWTLLLFWRATGVRPLDQLTLQASGSPRLPYAVPITAGLLLALWLRA